MDLPLIKGFAAACGVDIFPWQAQVIRGVLADAVEFEATIAHAMALGIDKMTARTLVKGLRRSTAWDWPRIRREIVMHANTTVLG